MTPVTPVQDTAAPPPVHDTAAVRSAAGSVTVKAFVPVSVIVTALGSSLPVTVRFMDPSTPTVVSAAAGAATARVSASAPMRPRASTRWVEASRARVPSNSGPTGCQARCRGRSARPVGYDVDQRAARLSKHEAPHSPVLVAERVGDLEALLHGPGVDGIDIGHLYRDAGGGRVVIADDGHLGRRVGRRRDRQHPAEVHRHLEAEHVDEELARLRGPFGLDVRHCPADHGASVSIARSQRGAVKACERTYHGFACWSELQPYFLPGH